MADFIENSSSSTVVSHSYKDLKIAIKLSRHDHYHKWVFLMKQLLIRTSNWNEATNSPSDTSASFSIISENIHEDHLDLIMDETLASAAWNILQKKFAGKSVSHQLSCIRSLVEFKYSSNMQGNLNSLRSIGRSLIAASGGEEKIDILNLIAIFALESLPEEFIGTKAVLSLKSSISLQEIEDAIIQAPLSGPNTGSSVAHAHQAKVSDGSDGAKCSHGRFANTCWSCHPEKRPSCEKCKAEGRKSYHKTGSRFCSFVGNQGNKAPVQAYMSSSVSSHSWVVDSGCSDHMTPQASILNSYQPSDRQILTASGAIVTCQGQGSCNISSNVQLNSVLHSDSLSENLLSVSSMADRGHITVFDKEHCYTVSMTPAVQSSISNIFKPHAFLTGYRAGGLYVTRPQPTSPSSALVSVDTWHQRMGHLHPAALSRLPSMVDGVALQGQPNPDCDACLKHKAKRSPYPHSQSRAMTTGELVHIDLGVLNLAYSFQGHRYYLLCVDDYSRYSFIFFLRKKSESAAIITNLLERIHNQTGKYSRYIRTDNALEFLTNSLNDFLASKGISRQMSCAHTPEQNGVVERMNQTIVNSGNAMLEFCGLPKQYWNLAYETAVYIRNLSPTSALDSQTPHEAWFGKRPDISHLRIFGEIAYSHVPKHKRTKLEPKAEPLYLVGYGQVEGTKGWKLLDPTTDRVIVTADVRFLAKPVFPTYRAEPTLSPSSPTPTLLEEVVITSQIDLPSPDSSGMCPSQVTNISQTAPPSETSSISTSPVTAPTSPSTPVEPLELPAPSDIDPSNILPTRLRSRALRAAPTEPIPQSYDDIANMPDAEQWEAAVQSELQSLSRHDTWTPCPVPSGRSAISSKWVFKIKRNADGTINKYKARLVARGFSQQEGVDYHDTFAPVAKHTSMRVLLSLAASEDFEIHQADVETAFLIPKLDEEVYMRLPDGQTVRLQKCLYGLKQSPRVWNTEINTFLLSLGLTSSPADPCIYSGIVFGSKVYLGLYVDDLVIACKSLDVLAKLKKSLNTQFTITDLGEMKYCLGFEITRHRSDRSIVMHQQSYIHQILHRANMTTCKPARSPLDASVKLSKLHCPQSPEEKAHMQAVPYASTVGALIYLVSGTRPDIAHAVAQVCRFMPIPGSNIGKQ